MPGLDHSKDVFRVRGFQPWLYSRVLITFSKQMRALVISWQVYQLTHDPLALGYIGLWEAVPYLAVALWVGHWADRSAKRNIFLVAGLGHFLCCLSLFLLSLHGRPPLILIYAVVGAAGIFTSFEMVSSMAIIQLVVPQRIFPTAIAWHLIGFQLATIAGPLIGGWLVGKAGFLIAYGVIASLSLPPLLFIPCIPKLPSQETGETPGLQSIIEGLRFILSRRIILSAMALDMLSMLFGDVIAILPIYAAMLGTGVFGLGLLRAAPPVGSLVMATLQTLKPVIKSTWTALLRAVFVFGVAILVFAVSKNIYLSLLMLAISGVADAFSVVIRQSIYQANTPDAMRGRVASVSGIFIRTSNEIGAFESGLAAKLMGTVPSVIFGGTMTLIVAAFMRWKYRDTLEAPPTESEEGHDR